LTVALLLPLLPLDPRRRSLFAGIYYGAWRIDDGDPVECAG
jgi:hypothetical protein